MTNNIVLNKQLYFMRTKALISLSPFFDTKWFISSNNSKAIVTSLPYYLNHIVVLKYRCAKHLSLNSKVTYKKHIKVNEQRKPFIAKKDLSQFLSLHNLNHLTLTTPWINIFNLWVRPPNTSNPFPSKRASQLPTLKISNRSIKIKI